MVHRVALARLHLKSHFGTSFLALFLQRHRTIQEAQVPDGRLHIYPTPLCLHAVIDNRCLTDALEEAVDAFGAIATADSIDAHWDFEQTEPLGVGALTDITREIRRRYLAVISTHRRLLQHIFSLGNETSRCTSPQP